MVRLTVPSARRGRPWTGAGSALRAASAAERGAGPPPRAAAVAGGGGVAADLTVWASSLRPRTPSGSSSAGTWRSRGCWTRSPRVSLRPASCRPRAALRALLCGRGPFPSGRPAPAAQLPPWHGCGAAAPRAASALCAGRRLGEPVALSPQSAWRPAAELARPTWCGSGNGVGAGRRGGAR